MTQSSKHIQLAITATCSYFLMSRNSTVSRSACQKHISSLCGSVRIVRIFSQTRVAADKAGIKERMLRKCSAQTQTHLVEDDDLQILLTLLPVGDGTQSTNGFMRIGCPHGFSPLESSSHPAIPTSLGI